MIRVAFAAALLVCAAALRFRPFVARGVGRVEAALRMTSPPPQQQQPPQTTRAHAILGGLAATGALETGYLTATKLSGVAAMCTTSGVESTCNSVLTGPYSQVPFVNVPLAAVAFLAYTSVVALSLRASSSPGGRSGSGAENSLILVITTTLATFSAYLMFLLTTVLQATCPYCYASAALSFCMAIVAWTNRIVPNATRAFVLTFSSMAVTAMGSGLLFYATSIASLVPAAQASTAPAAALVQQESSAAAAAALPKKENKPPAVTNPSSQQALAVARRLEALDAKMYGAYWCSHCYNQKQALGTEAVHMFEYIECDKEGKDSQYPACKAKKIPGYPTWELDGKFYPGEKDLDELEQLLDKVEESRK